MQPLSYQKQSSEERKAVVLKISHAFMSLDKLKFPKIYSQIHSSNTTKVAILNAIIEQIYALDFDLERSFLAVEENI